MAIITEKMSGSIGLIALILVAVFFGPTLFTLLNNKAMIWFILIIAFIWFLRKLK